MISRRAMLAVPAALAAARGQGSGRILYRNALASQADLRGFRLEGAAKMSFPGRRMRLESGSNFVFWCPQIFPDNIEISWDFRPLVEPGLAIFFFAAVGIGGKDLFDPSLPKRTGDYPQYHSGSINALHVSYFRRRYPEERAFHLCNLRKSKGFHLVAQAADPIPSVPDVQAPFRIAVRKKGPQVRFAINGLTLFDWTDDGRFGPALTSGRIGFRQMEPLVAEYANLVVRAISDF